MPDERPKIPDLIQRLADYLGGSVEKIGRCPDGSGFAAISWPLPSNRWLTAEGFNVPPMPFRMGVGEERSAWAEKIMSAARYAIRASTDNGRLEDFDPDAMVLSFIVGMLGYWTRDGLSEDAAENPDPVPSLVAGDNVSAATVIHTGREEAANG